MKKDGYENVKDGLWARPDGATIRRVNPKGLWMYAVRLPNSRRPVWVDGLKEAKALR